MKLSPPLYIFTALGAALILAAIGLWHFDSSSRQELARAKRQFAETHELIAKYENLRSLSQPAPVEPAGGLFGEVNRIGTDLNLTRRIETLRPSGETGAGESLDLQIRGLYLVEFLRFLQRVENLGNVKVERLTLTRPANRLLDMEMRLSRSGKNS